MLPLLLKLGIRKHLMVGLASGGLIPPSTARLVMTEICDMAEQSDTLTLEDYIDSYAWLADRNRAGAPTSTTLAYLPFPASTAWARDGAPPKAWSKIYAQVNTLKEWKLLRHLNKQKHDWTHWLNDKSIKHSRSERVVILGALKLE